MRVWESLLLTQRVCRKPRQWVGIYRDQGLKFIHEQKAGWEGVCGWSACSSQERTQAVKTTKRQADLKWSGGAHTEDIRKLEPGFQAGRMDARLKSNAELIATPNALCKQRGNAAATPEQSIRLRKGFLRGRREGQRQNQREKREWSFMSIFSIAIMILWALSSGENNNLGWEESLGRNRRAEGRSFSVKKEPRTSSAVQELRVHLPTQGMRAQSQVQDSWSHGPQLLGLHPRATKRAPLTVREASSRQQRPGRAKNTPSKRNKPSLKKRKNQMGQVKDDSWTNLTRSPTFGIWGRKGLQGTREDEHRPGGGGRQEEPLDSGEGRGRGQETAPRQASASWWELSLLSPSHSLREEHSPGLGRNHG